MNEGTPFVIVKKAEEDTPRDRFNPCGLFAIRLRDLINETLVVIPLDNVCSFDQLKAHVDRFSSHIRRPFQITGNGLRFTYNEGMIEIRPTDLGWLMPNESNDKDRWFHCQPLNEENNTGEETT